MGLFDFLSKKDAPENVATGTPDVHSPDAPPERGTTPAPLDEAARALNQVGQHLNEAIKPLGEAAKPLGEAAKTQGKAFLADMTAASRDLGTTLREATSSASTPTPSTPAATSTSATTRETDVMVPSTAASEVPTAAPAPPDATAIPVAPDAVSSFAPTVESTSVASDFETQPVAWAPVESVPFSPNPSSSVTDAAPLETAEAEPASVNTPVADAPVASSAPSVPVAPNIAATPLSATPVAPSVSTIPATPAVAVAPSVSTTPATPVAPAVAVAPAALDAEGNLEEFALPLPVLAPAPLQTGDKFTLTPEANAPVELTVASAPEVRGEFNVYRAQMADGTVVSLREAAQNSEAASRLERENAARRATGSPQIPAPLAFGTHGERVYLADALNESETTFASQLDSNAPLAEQISTLTQASAALVQLHKAGFVHGALRPEAILLGKPVRLSGFESLSPTGQKNGSTSSFAGYGAPEIVAGEPLDARTDIYSLGALLHRVVSGQGVPETGFDDTTFSPALLLPGVPQILAKTLGSPATRYSDMSGLHRDLVRLRARLRPLARHQSAGATTIGLESGRTTNQDAWGELRGQREGEDGALEWTAWVVSDGMGGMASGEVASQTAVAAILREAALWSATFDGKMPTEADHAALVKNWTREANRDAVEAMDKIGARGGCTLVCGLVLGKRMTLAHVGDCRTYLWRGGELRQITRDHSYVMSLVLQGEITKDQMRDHPDRSKITRSLGDRHPLPDYFVDGLEVETKQPTLDLQKGDILLAFSDGVWEPVLEDEMKTIISGSSLEEAAHQLINAAMREGGPDNATAYLLQMTESAPVVVKAIG